MSADFILYHLNGAIQLSIFILILSVAALILSRDNMNDNFDMGCLVGIAYAGILIIGLIWLCLHVFPYVQL